MRKILAVIALAAVLALPMAKPAHAFGGEAFAVLPTPLAVGTTLAPAVLFALIATNTPFPLCGSETGLTCYGDYPQDPKRADILIVGPGAAAVPAAYHPIKPTKTHWSMVDGNPTISCDGVGCP